MPYRDDDFDYLDPAEFPEPEAEREDGEMVRCPYCKKMIYEEAEQCPLCSNYISEEEVADGPKPWWVIAGAIVLLIVIFLFWI